MSSKEVGIEEARKVLGDLVTQVTQTGADIILTRRGRPVARLAPLEPAMTETAYLISAVSGDIVPGAELSDPDIDIDVQEFLDRPDVAAFCEEQGYGVDNPDEVMYLLRESDPGTIPAGHPYLEVQIPAAR